MYKGTSGPWFINTGDRNQQFIRASRSDDLKYIARVHPMGSGVAYHDGDDPETPSEEARANASLIAAAPDLLEAMNSAPIPSKYHGENGFDVDQFLADYAVFSAMKRAAIAKARGEV